MYNPTIEFLGEEISPKAVLVNSRTSRIFGIVEINRNTGKNMVSKPSSKIKTTSRIRARAFENRIIPIDTQTIRYVTSISDGRTATVSSRITTVVLSRNVTAQLTTTVF